MSKNISSKDLIIIVDEATKALDAAVERITFCFAEVPLNCESEKALKEISDFKSHWTQENPNLKFQFANFNKSDDIDDILQIITELRPTIKLFVFYDISSKHDKLKYLKQAIEIASNNNYRTEQPSWVIEDAEGYKSAINCINLTQDTSLTIIPDSFCSLFARVIDDDANDKIATAYAKIKPLIRLQYFSTNKNVLPLSKRKVI